MRYFRGREQQGKTLNISKRDFIATEKGGISGWKMTKRKALLRREFRRADQSLVKEKVCPPDHSGIISFHGRDPGAHTP